MSKTTKANSGKPSVQPAIAETNEGQSRQQAVGGETAPEFVKPAASQPAYTENVLDTDAAVAIKVAPAPSVERKAEPRRSPKAKAALPIVEAPAPFVEAPAPSAQSLVANAQEVAVTKADTRQVEPKSVVSKTAVANTAVAKTAVAKKTEPKTTLSDKAEPQQIAHINVESAKSSVASPRGATLQPLQAVQERLRSDTENGILQFRMQYSTMKGKAETATEKLEESFEAAQSGVKLINQKMLELFQAQTLAGFSHVQALFTAKSIEDAVKIQQNFANEQIKSLQSQTLEFAELARKLSSDVVEPVKTSVAVAFRA